MNKAGCISFAGQKYEVGLSFIDCSVDVVYDPADISELTIEYKGHPTFKVKQLIIGERAGKRPKLPAHLTPQPIDSSRLLAVATEKNRERRQLQIPAVSYLTVRRLQATLNPMQFRVLYLADSNLTPRHFYKGILAQLGCEAKFYRGDAKRQLHRGIELMRGIDGLRPVVVVDEAHLLDREMLEEVRFLLNYKMDAQSPMALILLGQSELWERFHLQAYAAIRQRIDIQCKLSHFDRSQVGDYVKRHLTFAGANRDIFSDGAIEEIYRYSSAACLINKTCTHCLFCGSQNGRQIN